MYGPWCGEWSTKPPIFPPPSPFSLLTNQVVPKSPYSSPVIQAHRLPEMVVFQVSYSTKLKWKPKSMIFTYQQSTSPITNRCFNPRARRIIAERDIASRTCEKHQACKPARLECNLFRWQDDLISTLNRNLKPRKSTPARNFLYYSFSIDTPLVRSLAPLPRLQNVHLIWIRLIYVNKFLLRQNEKRRNKKTKASRRNAEARNPHSQNNPRTRICRIVVSVFYTHGKKQMYKPINN